MTSSNMQSYALRKGKCGTIRAKALSDCDQLPPKKIPFPIRPTRSYEVTIPKQVAKTLRGSTSPPQDQFSTPIMRTQAFEDRVASPTPSKGPDRFGPSVEKAKHSPHTSVVEGSERLVRSIPKARRSPHIAVEEGPDRFKAGVEKAKQCPHTSIRPSSTTPPSRPGAVSPEEPISWIDGSEISQAVRTNLALRLLPGDQIYYERIRSANGSWSHKLVYVLTPIIGAKSLQYQARIKIGGYLLKQKIRIDRDGMVFHLPIREKKDIASRPTSAERSGEDQDPLLLAIQTRSPKATTSENFDKLFRHILLEAGSTVNGAAALAWKMGGKEQAQELVDLFDRKMDRLGSRKGWNEYRMFSQKHCEPDRPEQSVDDLPKKTTAWVAVAEPPRYKPAPNLSKPLPALPLGADI